MSFDLNQILPHRAPMCLLDSVKSIEADKIQATVRIHETSMFYQEGRVPAWVGIEYMAQTMAAYGGYFGRQSGEEKAPIGFLLGARAYKSKVTHFHLGEVLEIEAVPVLIEAELSNFRCRIVISGQEVATATITAYKPSAEFIQQLKDEK